ncbi:MAG TPA: NADH-quinone oxidoreductase subunit NuoE [Coriobacteriia bacterium]
MLTAKEREEVDAAVAMSGRRRAACIDAMMSVQAHRGWLSDETLEDLAEYLRMTPAELDSVATFYNLIFRKPVGRHVILVCDSVSCWLLDYETLLDHLKSRLGVDIGGTTSDGRFTLLTSVCLGACDRAPVMMIDGDQYGELTPQSIDSILAEYE